MSRNSELINGIFVKIAEKEEKRGTDSLNTEQQILGTIWHVYGIVGNGGIPYFLEHTFDVEEVARAYEAVGMPESAALLRKAIAKLPNSRRPSDFKKFIWFLDQHEDFFDALSNEFWATQRKVEKVLAAYIKQHPEAFKEFM